MEGGVATPSGQAAFCSLNVQNDVNVVGGQFGVNLHIGVAASIGWTLVRMTHCGTLYKSDWLWQAVVVVV